jgi:Family of unknown function (DUF5767)
MMNGPSVTIHDMQNFVENMATEPDIQISSNIGNVIELGGDDLGGDDLGIGLLSNTSVKSRPVEHNSSQSVSILEPIDDIQIGKLEPLEAISFDIPSSSSSMPEINVNRDSSSSFGNSSSYGSSSSFGGFDNDQTASGPSISLAAANRLNPEEERKQKIELINKLSRLEQKGFTLTKRFTLDNTLDEIKEEFDRLVDAKNLEASLRFQRQCLMGFATGFEYLNGKFNPFDWQLDGWSESVHENIEDFDEVFEELYDKYKGRGNMPPEAKLLMSLVGSGFMFHMSNTFFRQKFATMDAGDIFRNNPQLAKQFAAAAAQQAGPGFGNFMGAAMGVNPPMTQSQPMGMGQMPMGQMQMGGMPVGGSSNPGAFYNASNAMGPTPTPQMPQNMAAMPQQPVQRREMKGPSGVDDILKTFQEVRDAELNSSPVAMPQNSLPVFNQQPAVQAISEIASLHSQQDDGMIQADTVRTGMTGSGRRGRRKAAIPVQNTFTLNL